MRCQHTTVGGSWACAKCPLEKYVDRHPRGAECAVRVLGARLSTRGIPRLSRSRASPCPALEVRGIQGTASERITTVLLDSTRSQLFSNGTGHPARRGQRACGLAALRLDPVAIVRQQRAHVLLEPIRHTQRDAAWREHLHHLMHDALGHGPRAWTDRDGQEQLALRVDRGPDPLRRARQTLDSLLFAHLSVLDSTEDGI